MVEQLAQEYAGKVKVVGLNAHDNYDTASAYGIMGIPTLILYKAGKEVGRMVGAAPKERIVQEMQSKLGV